MERKLGKPITSLAFWAVEVILLVTGESDAFSAKFQKEKKASIPF